MSESGARLKRVVSVSLGSSARDHRAEVELLGIPFAVERCGTDGSLQAALELLRSLDGHVDALGLGGIDVYLYAGEKRFALRDGLKLLNAVRHTPVTDGSGVKGTLERDAVAYLRDELGVSLRGIKVLMVSALDRFGMAKALVEAGADVLFGDFLFALDVERPVRDLAEFEALAERYLPDACKLPFQFFYPTGKKQDRPPQPKYPQYYAEAEILAGDFHFMRQFMPERLDGKFVVTNTLTARDLDDLRSRGVAAVVTTTPAFSGRSFGANVIEAALLALLEKRAEEVLPGEYEALVKRLRFTPRTIDFRA